MPNHFTWVPWFKELAEKICDGGAGYLVERVRQFDWLNEPATLRFGADGVDPFSFFYRLSQLNTTGDFQTVYQSVHEKFNMGADLPTLANGEKWLTIPEFWPGPGLIYDENESHSTLLWQTFADAMQPPPSDDPSADERFRQVIELDGVGIPTLTKIFHLINPDFYLPIDRNLRTALLGITPPAPDEWDVLVKRPTRSAYAEIIRLIQMRFPECAPYEIYTFLLVLRQSAANGLARRDRQFFHVSTDVTDNGDDYWEDTKDRRGPFGPAGCVYTAGPGNPSRPYPLTQARPGDVILVRYGLQKGHAIGVVEKNEYTDRNGFADDAVIHVFWINKATTPLDGLPLPAGLPRIGFSNADQLTVNAFRTVESYRKSLEILVHLSNLTDASHEKVAKENAADATGRERTSRWRGRWAGHTIKCLVKENPRREGAHGWRAFQFLLDNGGEVSYEKYRDAGHTNNHLKWDLDRKRLSITRSSPSTEPSPGKSPGSRADAVLPAYDPAGRPLNTILYGPPGTGKTYTTFRKCVEICDGQTPQAAAEIQARYGELTEQGRVEFVTFHQSYGYEEFVEGLRPQTPEADGAAHGFRLEATDGVLKRMAKRASEAPSIAHVLVIDEINRANVSKVMGELVTLLEEDKREGAANRLAVTLPHSHESFSLPGNLHILGTMNTADRSIALLDTALRRRFAFEELPPRPDLLTVVDGVNLPAVLRVINERLEWFIDRDHLIGHAWLMSARNRKDVDDAMRGKIIPLVAECFYDDWAKVRAVFGGGNEFVVRERLPAPPNYDDEGEARYRWTIRDEFPEDAYRRLTGAGAELPAEAPENAEGE